MDAEAGRERAPVLRLVDISKEFSGVHALEGVSLSLQPGHIHGLVGENGAGKSTLIKTVGGYHRPSSGHIYVDGEEIKFHRPQESLRAGISIVHQEFADCPALSVAENVFIGRPLPRGRSGLVDRSAMNRSARKIFDDLEFDIDVTRMVRSLSLEQRKMTEIARALAADAKVLILDEPTAALEQEDSIHLFRVLRQLRERGLGILYVSHRLEEIFDLCNEVTVLRDGRLVGSRAAKGLDTDRLIRMMVGRSLENAFPKADAEIGEPVLVVDGLQSGSAFRDISFTVRRGEILGMAGLAGSGRSEVANALFGLRGITAGTVSLNGQQVTIHRPADAITAGVGYVPKNRKENGIVGEMSVGTNATLPCLPNLSGLAGVVNTRRERRIVREALERFSVKCASPRQAIGRLSGGNQQKVVMARWLLMEPKLLIVDELTQGVDVGAKAEIHRLIGEMVVQGLAVIMISSDLPELLAASDRIVVFHEGEITGELSREEADEENIMRLSTNMPKEAA